MLEEESFIAMEFDHALCAAGAADVMLSFRLTDDILDVASQFDCAVVDLGVEGASTLSFAEHLLRTRIPFVVATASPLPSLGARFNHIPVLQKPNMVDRLVPFVRHALDTQQSPVSALLDPNAPEPSLIHHPREFQ